MGTGITEMDTHFIDGLADFLYQRYSRGSVCGRSAWYGVLSSWRSVLRAGLHRPTNNYSYLRFTMCFAACLVASAFSFQKSFTAKRIGVHRSRIRSPIQAWARSGGVLSPANFRLMVIIMGLRMR